ncbi:MAG TPA: hypothetical protein EYN32_06245, partial [Phycisphaerales bacterium]|nr:hypothetical protein [Phycisphaerales bacterium]
IEKRIDNVGAPCQLYNESDLLVRTIRDILRPSIDVIVVDSESSYERITSFLKIAAPRSSRKIIQYRDASPIFHAFDIEKQIDEIHCREVDLPSGGRLVIDQTEALVAIDVNSGKSRGAKNSEANAVNTNLEAADAICRHLRLRDLGGIVINDLIDMGQSSNRRKVEKRFQENLERDRARSTVLPISRFGLMEMTRQRIRPSVLDSHYAACSQCDGRGNVKTTEEVAADATRHCGWLLHHENVSRVELTCSASVGTFLLSNKRGELDAYEQRSKKRIVVRISEELAKDRLIYYAYDARGADIELETLVASKPLSIAALIKADNSYVADEENSEEKTGRRRSRRRGKKNLPLAEAASISAGADLQEELDSLDKVKPEVKQGKKQQLRKGVKKEETPADSAMRVFQFARSIGKSSKEVLEQCKQEGFAVRNHMSTMTSEIITKLKEGFEELVEKKKPRRRRRRKNNRTKKSSDAVATTTTTETAPVDTNKTATENKEVKKKSKKSRSRYTSNRSRKKANAADAKETVETKVEVVEPKKKARKTLYGGRRRSVTTDEVQASRDSRA